MKFPGSGGGVGLYQKAPSPSYTPSHHHMHSPSSAASGTIMRSRASSRTSMASYAGSAGSANNTGTLRKRKPALPVSTANVKGILQVFIPRFRLQK